MSTFWLLFCFATFIQSGFCNSLVNKIQDGIKYKGCSLKEKGPATLIPDYNYMNGQGLVQVSSSNNGGMYPYGGYGTNLINPGLMSDQGGMIQILPSNNGGMYTNGGYGPNIIYPGFVGSQGLVEILPPNNGGLYTNGGYGTSLNNGGYYGYGNYAPSIDYNYVDAQTQTQYVQPQVEDFQGGNTIYVNPNNQGLAYGGATTELINGVNYGGGVSQIYPGGYGYGSYGGYGGYANQLLNSNAQVQQYSG